MEARDGGGGGGGGGPRGAEHLTLTLVHAGPSLYGAALTTVGAALPLLFCYVVVFRQVRGRTRLNIGAEEGVSI